MWGGRRRPRGSPGPAPRPFTGDQAGNLVASDPAAGRILWGFRMAAAGDTSCVSLPGVSHRTGAGAQTIARRPFGLQPFAHDRQPNASWWHPRCVCAPRGSTDVSSLGPASYPGGMPPNVSSAPPQFGRAPQCSSRGTSVPALRLAWEHRQAGSGSPLSWRPPGLSGVSTQLTQLRVRPDRFSCDQSITMKPLVVSQN